MAGTEQQPDASGQKITQTSTATTEDDRRTIVEAIIWLRGPFTRDEMVLSSQYPVVASGW